VAGEFSDFDELAETVAGWGLDWIQLDRGPMRARIRQLAGPSVLLSRFEFGRKFHQRGTSPRGMRTVAVIGRRSPQVKWRGGSNGDHGLVVFPVDSEFDFVSDPDFHGDTLSVSEDRLRAVAETIGLPDPTAALPSGQGFLEADPACLESLRRQLDDTHARIGESGCRASPDVHHEDVELPIVSTLCRILVGGRNPQVGRPDPVVRVRAMNRALEFIEACADDAPTIEMICAAAEASWRTLDYAFRERFDLTPKQYLTAARLHRVRQGLMRSGGELAISEIAAYHGFWHMGKLAADYRRHFGELPSETVKRSDEAPELAKAPSPASRHARPTPAGPSLTPPKKRETTITP